MNFSMSHCTTQLQRTPKVLNELLKNLDDSLILTNEGPNTWSPYDIIGHLIHCEKTDWLPRAKIILSDSENKTFEPFDRFAQLRNERQDFTLLLQSFEKLRIHNIQSLQEMNLTNDDLAKEGVHPEFGKVNLKQLLCSWVVHDWNHLQQISRVLASNFREEVGPWKNYMGIYK